MRSPARPSPIARTIGIAPPTAASKRSCRPCCAASVRSGAAWRAITCLFAVTTDLPAVDAANGFDDDVGVGVQDIVDVRRPRHGVIDAGGTALLGGAAVEDVRELKR